MKHLFIPYELAVIAKEKGFNEPCLARYDIDKTISQTNIESNSNGFNEQVTNDNLLVMVASPLYQQIIDWFREKHNVIIYVDARNDLKFKGVRKYYIRDIWRENYTNSFNNHYEALNKAIEDALKII